MRALSLLSSMIILAACATPAPEVPDHKIAQEEAVNGFRMAVVDVCLASAMAGKPLSDYAGEDGPISAETNASFISMAKAKPGDSVFSSRKDEDILIKSSGKDCEVMSKGPLTRAALDAVGEALSDPHGFVAETPAEAKGSNIYKRYSKKVGSQTYRVTLAAADAQSMSGTLTATVSSTPQG